MKICPMGALVKTDGIVSFNQARCIGCGLCVSVCAFEAVEIVRRPEKEQKRIPANTLATYSQMALKSGKWNTLTAAGLMLKSYWHRLVAPRQ